MSDPGDLQFDRAEPTSAAAAASCTVCKQPLQGSYYAINGRAVCASCRDKVAQQAASGSFMTALLLGLGAAVLGAGIWFGFAALTHRSWSLVAVAVGLLVGSAVRKGSRGFGSWKYQALAIILTYLSVVLADASLAMHEARGSSIDVVRLLGFALALPVLEGFQSPLFLVILAFALYEAWKLNKVPAFTITGPHQLAPSP